MEEKEVEGANPHVTPTPKKSLGKFSVDSLSRDDLIKQVKKQSLMLQKMKLKLDEVSQECVKLKEEAIPINNEYLVKELQVLKSERDQLQTEVKNVKQIVISLEQEKQSKMTDLDEQLSAVLSAKNCLQDELSTLKLNMEKEHTKKIQLEVRIGDLESLLNEIGKTRDDLMEDMTALKESYENLKVERERAKDQVVTLEEELNQKMEGWAHEKERLTNQLSEFVAAKETSEANLRDELTQIRKREMGLNEEIEKLSKDKEHLQKSTHSLEVELTSLQEKVKLTQESNSTKISELVAIETQLVAEQKEADSKVQNLMKEFEEKEKERKEELDIIKGNYMKLKEEHNLLVTSKAELEKMVLQLRNESSSVGENSTTLQDKIESLNKQLHDQSADHREEVKKLKAYAVKIKKELSEVHEKEKRLKEELNVLTQSLTEEKTRSDYLTSSMNQSVSDHDNLSQQLSIEQKKNEDLSSLLSEVAEERDKVNESFHLMEDNHNSLRSELEAVKVSSLNFQSQLTETIRNLNDVAAENESLREELEGKKEELDQVRQKLLAAEKEVKASSLMNLELADYERSVETLRGQLKEKEIQQVDLEKEISSRERKCEDLNNELASCKDDSSQKDDIITKMKAMLRKSTKELTEARAQVNENDQKANDAKAELESAKQTLEMSKVEIARLTASFQSDLEQSQSSASHYKQLMNVLEAKVLSLQSELTSISESLHSKEQEFENYKVRVHSVLKQRQTMPSVTEVESSLRQQHEVELLKAKSELIETRERLTNLLSDHSDLEQEHQILLTTHDNHVHESEEMVYHLQKKLQECEEKYSTRTRELDDLMSQLRLEIVENTAAFKSQIYAVQKDHQSQLSLLQDQLKLAHKEMARFQQESDSAIVSKGANNNAASQCVNSKQQFKENAKASAEMRVFPTEERSSGEGMDHSELETSGLATPVSSLTPQQDKDKFFSFEKLLSNSSTEMSSLSRRSLSPNLETVDELKEQVILLSKRVSHLTGLLHESEANCMRYTDQTKLLKEEIRRLERNQERQKEALSNMEYLKNVTLKFLHTTDEEKMKLIPIITRLLQLSQQEKHFLQETLKGRRTELPDPTGNHDNSSATSGKGWSNYLQRWTGY